VTAPTQRAMAGAMLFAVSSVLAGFLGGLGLTLGHAVTQHGLWLGGMAGGAAGVVGAAVAARHRQWIKPSQFAPAVLGGLAGFLVAMALAVHTVATPVAPLLSSTLIGFGTLAGARRAPAQRDVPDS